MLQGEASTVNNIILVSNKVVGHTQSPKDRWIGTPVSHLMVCVGNAALCMVLQYLSEVEHLYLASFKKFMLIIILEAFHPAVSTHCTLNSRQWVCPHTRMLTGYGMSEESVNSQF